MYEKCKPPSLILVHLTLTPFVVLTLSTSLLRHVQIVTLQLSDNLIFDISVPQQNMSALTTKDIDSKDIEQSRNYNNDYTFAKIIVILS